MGTPEAAVPALARCLEDGHNIVAVWTQPDKPSGRGRRLAESPVKTFALAHNLRVHQPARIKTEESKKLFASYDADVAVVVAYGRILPSEYLNAPRAGAINVHFSLLPHYRGAAPVNWAIINGESTTGVTTMFVEEELDAGPILLQVKTGIGSKETATELMSRLSLIGAELLSETLARLDTLTPTPQHDQDATFAPLLTKQNGEVSWSNPATAIERLIRGLQPWPNAFTQYNSRRLVIWQGEPVLVNAAGDEGAIIIAHGDDLTVKCGGESALRLIEVQPEGGRRMLARDFLNGFHIRVGDKLGRPQ